MHFRPCYARRVVVWLFLFVLTALAACHGARPRTGPDPRTAIVVTAEQIEKSGATTAWQALQLTVPVVVFQGTTQSGSDKRLHVRRRGRTSIYLNDDPRVFLDHVRVVDLSVLDNMPARDIAAIVVLNGLDGTTYYVTSAVNGVVLIFTHLPPLPQSPRPERDPEG